MGVVLCDICGRRSYGPPRWEGDDYCRGHQDREPHPNPHEQDDLDVTSVAKDAGKKYREEELFVYNNRYQEHGENDFTKGFIAGYNYAKSKLKH